MTYPPDDYSFSSLVTNRPRFLLVNTLAYLVALVDSAQNEIMNLKKAKFVLSYLFEVEEQVESASELASLHQSHHFPKQYFPQSPAMLTIKWSPIAALLESGWAPEALVRTTKGFHDCASGIWAPRAALKAKPYAECETPEELFWYLTSKVVEKANERGLLISIIACPGWMYESNLQRPQNLSLV